MNDTIRKQIMVVRATGKTNMFNIRRVQAIAAHMGFHELAAYVEEHRAAYVNFLLTGSNEVRYL